MSIGDVCPKESEEPPQTQDQPSPPTQDEEQAQDDGNEAIYHLATVLLQVSGKEEEGNLRS